MNLSIEELIENIIFLIHKDERISRELAQAKEFFFEKTGKIHISAASYQNRINCFLNWFLFDWNTAHKQSCIYKNIISKFGASDLDERHYQLHPNVNSIFILKKEKKEEIKVIDLFSKKKYLVPRSNFFQGVEKYCCFESRLHCINKVYYFSNYLILHPREVSSYVQKKVNECENKKTNFRELLFKLHHTAHKWESYKHFPLKKVYS